MLAAKEKNAFKAIFKSTMEQSKLSKVKNICSAAINLYDVKYKRLLPYVNTLSIADRGLVFNSYSRAEIAKEILEILK